MTKVVNKIEDLEGEIWKPVVGYEGFYEVSNLGRVKSLPRWVNTANGGKQYRPGEVLKPQFNGAYYHVRLSVYHKIKIFLVHRLVATSFIDSIDGSPWVNHKNGIKTDNRVENLEWSNVSDNTAHAYRIGLANPLTGKNHPHYGKESVRRKKVFDSSTGTTFNSVEEAAKSVGVSRSHLSSMLTGFRKNWTSIRYA